MNSNFFFFSIASVIAFPFFINLKSSVTPRCYCSLNITFLASDINILSSRCTSYYFLAMSSSFQSIVIIVGSRTNSVLDSSTGSEIVSTIGSGRLTGSQLDFFSSGYCTFTTSSIKAITTSLSAFTNVGISSISS